MPYLNIKEVFLKEIFKRNPKQPHLPDEQAAEKTTNQPPVSEPTPVSAEPHQARWSFQKSNPTKNAAGIPNDLWVKCPKCKELLYSKELDNNKQVCHKCGHHFRLGAYARLAITLDENSFVEIDGNLISADPLNFANLVEPPYVQKTQQLREKTKLNEAVVTGYGTLETMPLVVCVCDFAFQGGSMGSVFGEKFVRAVELAMERGWPLLTVSASGGARMHEGTFSLMQMAKTTAALMRLGEEKLLHISLLTDPITGGVLASYASVADFILAEPGALIGFAGPRVIEQITKQKLPPGFQTSEFLLEHGMVDMVVARKELRTTLANLLRLYSPSALSQTQITQLEERVVYAR